MTLSDAEHEKKRMYFLCTGAGLLICLFAGSVLALLTEPLHLSAGLRHLFTQCPVFLLMLLAFFLAAKKTVPEGNPFNTLGLKMTPDFSIRKTILYFVFMLLVMLVLSFCMWVIENLFHFQLESQRLVTDAGHAGWGHTAAIFLSAVILAPIAEEILFRNMLYHSCRTILPQTPSILICALVFAALHFNLLQFLPLFAMGILLQTAYLRSRTLLTCILMHSAHNLLSLLVIRAIGVFEKFY